VLRAGRDHAEHLAQAILDVRDKLGLCAVCNNISDREICIYCSDPRRDPGIVCIVEEPLSIIGIETTREFEGRYHVGCDLEFADEVTISKAMEGRREM